MRFVKKSLGQNFLIDTNIIRKIIRTVDIKSRNILEIGPGKGALTNQILRLKPKTFSVIEKDDKLASSLIKKFQNFKNFKVNNKDFLRCDIEKIIKKDTIIFGNLPYNISSQILIKLIKTKIWPPSYTDLILMFQKEVADKILGRTYGRLTISSNYRLKVSKKFEISPNCFFPKPKVISTVLHFKPKIETIYKINNFENLEKITNIFFSNRRKIIKNSLQKILTKEKLIKLRNLDLNQRPEDLQPEIFYKIVQLYEEK
tara:strand:+ start:121 stop:894 length:774 start_codon:yes stop_codon:yes gene_type:complete